VNAGLLALAFALPLGVWVLGLKPAEVAATFPSSLFIVLVGVTYLFGIARANGALTLVTRVAVRTIGGSIPLLPLAFFLLAVVISSLGPGNIAAVAVLAPIALAIAGHVGIGALLMTVLVVNGANAGAFSPIAPTGIIANGLVAQIGLPPMEERIYLNSLLAQSAVALVGYVACGGLALWRAPRRDVEVGELLGKSAGFTWRQGITLAGIAVFVGAVGIGRVDVGLAALAVSAVLAVIQSDLAESALLAVPWDAILMLCGMTVLIQIVEKAGGLAVFTDLLCCVATPGNVPAILGLSTGIVSAYSSSSGVVMPLFIALVPELHGRIGGDPVAMVSAICVGSHLVDVSPLSTLGAICIASAAPHEDRRRLFNLLLVWGMSMSVVGAAVCWIFFG
jgi:di/tricarboxylate transporter